MRRSRSMDCPSRSSSQPEGDHIKKDKGKKVMYSEEAEKKSTESDSNDEAHMTGSMVQSFKKAKSEAAKQEGEVRKAELIDLLGLEVVHKPEGFSKCHAIHRTRNLLQTTSRSWVETEHAVDLQIRLLLAESVEYKKPETPQSRWRNQFEH
ncbi:hypothetical protein Tco_1255739 [Tanacetum coccineum]